MHLFLSTALTILLSFLPGPSTSANFGRSPSKDAVLLSDVEAVTLHAHRKTSHRRVSAIPQLTCVGPRKICSLYNVDVMRCVNAGSDYDENDVQWTCTADVPPEFKLGSTDVVCEGYRNADDPYVLKGSCGVEYRLLLSDLGEKRYGSLSSADDRSWLEYAFDLFIGIITMSVVLGLLAVLCCGNTRINSRRRNNGGWFGGGGGGGGGWWGGPPGPPPPYDYQPPGHTKYESWRPGFWSGALGGAAAGYAMGRRRSGRRYDSSPGPSRWGSGAGPSRSWSSPSTESTGFGSTRRR